MSIAKTILTNLINNPDFTKQTIPYLKSEYFEEKKDQVLFELVRDFTDKHNALPSREALLIGLDKRSENEDTFRAVRDNIVGYAKEPVESNVEWLIQESEKFCQERALYLTIIEAIEVINDNKKKLPKEALPKMFSDALAVCFDTKLGHDYLEDAEKRYEFYHRVENKIPFRLDVLNKATNGGVTRKTLNLVMAPIGKGKSAFLCDVAAGYLEAGLNVLYVTLEMSEESTAQRVDANLMDVDMSNINMLRKERFIDKIGAIKAKTRGKLIIREYPAASVNAGHVRYLLNELKLKKGFVPDVIVVDYLNLALSVRFKNHDSLYTSVKATAEEFRGLAVETNTVIWTATQVNRGGQDASDVEMGDVSESIGLPATLDLFLAIISTDELEEKGQIRMKQLKSRYADINLMKKFLLNFERGKSKFSDADGDSRMAKTTIRAEDLPSHEDSAENTLTNLRKKREFSSFSFDSSDQ